MKHLYFIGCLLCCLCTAIITPAQEAPPLNQNISEKPLLFAQLPDKIECNLTDLQKIFASNVSENINLVFGKFSVKGVVADKVYKSPRIVSFNIRLSNYNNALLNISFLIQADNTQKVIGRVIHPAHGDALILTEEKNHYYFIKQSQRFFMVE